MAFVDGVLIPVPEANRATYSGMAGTMAALFIECGAVEVVDCWGVDVPEGKLTSMPMALQLKPGEGVVFSWVRWPDKKARDDGWKKAMADPRMMEMSPNLFDGKRMIFGGFEVIQSSRQGG